MDGIERWFSPVWLYLTIALIAGVGVLCCVQWYRLPHMRNPDEHPTVHQVNRFNN
jgi:hypothetical protein